MSKAKKMVEGVVVSDKMNKTRAVRVARRFRYPLYEKITERSTKYYAHDERNESHVGDKVRMEHTRPLSRTKRWRITKIVEKKII